MAFVQIIEYQTSRPEEIQALQRRWEEETAGKRSATRVLACADRDRPNTYVTVVEFPSYDEAMRNSNLPATAAMAEQLAKLCDGPPSFRNLDLKDVLVG